MNAVGMTQAPTSPRPRSRGFSFKSDRSGGSRPKEDLTESPRDKQRKDILWKSSKANPNAALTEVQPAAANLLEESTIQPLRDVPHKDTHGNLITDPDLSNPTRPRLERPLDTIRSFERAIDNGYKRRTSYRADSYEQRGGQPNQSRRSSYYGNNQGGYDSRPSPGGGYYANQRDSYVSPGYGGNQRMRQGPGPRQASEPYYNQRPYGQHAHQQSQDTMNTHLTNGSDSTGPWASGTDPSSDNSSVERVDGPPPPPHSNAYNGSANGFQGGIPEEGGAYPYNQRHSRPIPLGNSAHLSSKLPPAAPRPEPEKRKSWLKRTFSKNG